MNCVPGHKGFPLYESSEFKVQSSDMLRCGRKAMGFYIVVLPFITTMKYFQYKSKRFPGGSTSPPLVGGDKGEGEL